LSAFKIAGEAGRATVGYQQATRSVHVRSAVCGRANSDAQITAVSSLNRIVTIQDLTPRM
jgi:hypothetical protein